MPSLRHGIAFLTACALLAPASATAATGGAAVPSSQPASQPAGGTVTQDKRATGRSSLDVASFSLNGSNFYEHGRSIRATFQLAGSAGAEADLKLVVVRGGTRVRVVPIGKRPAGSRHEYTLPTAGLPSGSLELRLSGRDSRGRALKSSAGARTITVQSHRFPVVGPHTFGGEGSKFGADRDGGKRRHQGQDVTAAEGTPMVAARGGVVRYTGNQPTGAGVYVVIHGAGESRDYVYMHLVEGSLLVKNGQTVRTGQLIGQVGNTGASQGAHLHVEIWQGVWQGGGTPIDPLPLLRAWDAWS